VSHKGAGRAAASRIDQCDTAADGARGFCQGLRMGDNVVGTLPIVQFGFPGELRDRLVAAVLTGEKTATTGLLVEWELDGDPVPRPGERFLVVDSTGVPVAVIEMSEVRVLRLGEVDLAIAQEEGEGFNSVEEWRLAHEAFWNDYADELRSRLDDSSWKLVDETPVVVERFRLISQLDT
jgi:uncharacterized protein YhfF